MKRDDGQKSVVSDNSRKTKFLFSRQESWLERQKDNFLQLMELSAGFWLASNVHSDITLPLFCHLYPSFVCKEPVWLSKRRLDVESCLR